jgi:transposase-like protein
MGDSSLEDAFPVGDGTADTAATVVCPYCGQAVEIVLDPGSGSRQEYVEDCEVCCRPWNVSVTYGADGSAAVGVEAADDSD